MPETKPKVLAVTLGSMERDGWVCPPLALTLIAMGRDARFETTFANVLGYRPHDYARNAALAVARDTNVDWTIQLDNDVAPAVSPLDIIANAPSDADVIACRYGVTKTSQSVEMFPKQVQFSSGNYQEVDAIAGGVLCIRSSVWRHLPHGPWFQIQCKQGSELLEWGCGEDVSFAALVRSKRMKVYLHKIPAGHLHTQDITKIAMMQ